MTRRIVLLVAALTVSSLWIATPQANADPHGALCHIAGKAAFSKGLTTEAQNVTYKFTGVLDNCAASDSAYTGAKLSAKGSGSLSCGQGTSKGVATIKWNTGKTSTVTYTTTSFGALVQLQGSVTKGQFAGDSAIGGLAFEANPPDCVGAGVKTANFDGLSGYGNYQ
jgi:hypothetical protein